MTVTSKLSLLTRILTAVFLLCKVLPAASSGVLVPSPGSPFATGSSPVAVVTGDFNGDGRPDIATANYHDSTVTILLGNGAGGFTAAPGSPFAVGTSPNALATGDFNNDGKLDLAITNSANNTVSVMLGNGSGGFTAASGSPFSVGAFPIGVVAGDFNGDHQLDLAVLNTSDRTVTLLLGNGTGAFTVPSGSVYSITTNPTGIAAGDFNGDGVQDIAVSSSGTGGLATIFLGGASGFTQASGSPFSVPGQSGANVAAGDWNHDGKIDLAFVGGTGQNDTGVLTIFLGSGTGTFTLGASGAVSTTFSAFYSVTPGDVDGDGNPDLVITSPLIGQVYVFLGNGAGAFVQAPGGSISTATDYSAQIADFNGDTRPDLVIANAVNTGTATVLLGALDPVTTTAAVSSGSNAVLVGTPVTLSATVVNTGFFLKQASGTVTFFDGGNNLGSATLVNGSAAITTSSLAAGNHTIVASYSGDAQTLAGSSSGVSVVVDSSAASISIYSGNGQAVNTNAPFSPLQVIVRDAGNLPIGGVQVTFSAPSSGASGTFASSPTVVTNAQGIATAPTLTANGTPGTFTVTATVASSSLSVGFSLTSMIPVALRFVPVTPCRIADTRNAAGPFGAPSITGQTTRNFTIPNSSCGIPVSAQAYSLNVTVVPQGGLGFLTVWPAGTSQPLASTLNSADGRIKANAAIIPAGSGGAISVFATNTTDLVLDIDGYFVPATSNTGLSFYSLPPCRIADTRNAAGPFGAPFLSGVSTRSFPVLSSSCGLPSTAQAYSLNFTAVPRTSTLAFITTWPTGQSQPLVSTLNAPTGVTTANAAIVPAGTGGAINVFATQDTDLVIDVNGYFAPPGSAGNLSLYSTQPCRILDSRLPSGSPAFSGTLNIGVSSSVCALPLSAQSYVLNATVVPTQGLGFLTLWPQGSTQPLVSTLNAIDGVVSGNLAIVPTSNGSVSAFASNPTYLVLDIFAYFAP